MKRTDFALRRYLKCLGLAALLCASLPLTLASCASVLGGESVNVNAFDTLETDSNIYIRIPVKVHSELTNNILKSVIGSEVADKYIKNVTDSLDTIYFGIGSASSKGRLQVAADGNISSATKLALSQTEYFSKELKHVNTAGMYTVFTEKNSGIQIVNPGSNLIMVSKDITPQLTKYDSEANAQTLASILTDSNSNSNNSDWKNSRAYQFVGNASTDNVRLYMDKPLSFITNLLGTSLSNKIFQLNSLEGDMRLLANGKYGIDLDLEFSQNNLVTKAVAFLKVALLLTNSSVNVIDDTHLTIKNIEVSVSQLQKMLGAF